jgi:hypothetical protein
MFNGNANIGGAPPPGGPASFVEHPLRIDSATEGPLTATSRYGRSWPH